MKILDVIVNEQGVIGAVRNLFSKPATRGAATQADDAAAAASKAAADNPEAAMGAGAAVRAYQQRGAPPSGSGPAPKPGDLTVNVPGAGSPNRGAATGADVTGGSAASSGAARPAAAAGGATAATAGSPKPMPAASTASKAQDAARLAAGAGAVGAVAYQAGQAGSSDQNADQKADQKADNKPNAAAAGGSFDDMSFGQAFAAARKAAGGAGGVFTWKGKEYQTNIKGEPYAPANQLKRVSAPAAVATPAASAATPAAAAPSEPSPQRVAQLGGAKSAADDNPEASMGAGQPAPQAQAQPAPTAAADNPEASMGAGQPAPQQRQGPQGASSRPEVQAAAQSAGLVAKGANAPVSGPVTQSQNSRSINSPSDFSGGPNTTTTQSNTSVQGTLKMGKADGPITFNGKTVNPGDSDYAQAEQALIASQRSTQQTRAQMRREFANQQAAQQGAASGTLYQSPTPSAVRTADFEESLIRLKQLARIKI